VRYFTKLVLLLLFVLLPVGVFASHAWGPYHWARTANPFTLKLGDNVTGTWDAYLAEASGDWSASSVLDTTIVGGNGGKNCRATAGRIEVCNRKYGNNGWLGLAQIWISDDHITKGLAKMNDTYFNTASYNTPAWRRLVMCQEIAHGFGLDHQDEAFGNANLGSCMDYTGDPDGPPSNEHPNAHDFEQLEAIYAHLDGFNSYDASTADAPSEPGNGRGNGNAPEGFDNRADWGRQIKDNGNVGLYVRELEGGQKLFTHVFWAH
jgi:hypothetical protein